MNLGSSVTTKLGEQERLRDRWAHLEAREERSQLIVEA